MAPMQKKIEKKRSKKKEMIAVEVKKEIIEKYEQGMRAVEIARFHKKSTSTSRPQRRRRERWRNPSLQMRLGKCVKFGNLQNFVEKHHLNKAVAGQAMNLFNDNVTSHLHKVLKRRQKQVSLDSFLVKVERREKDSIEPIDSSDSVTDSENCPTQ